MLSLADLTLWLLTTLVEIIVVYLFIIQGLFRKFLFLSFYFLLSVTISIGRYALYRYDFWSLSYFYFYYFTDALLTVFLFLSISQLSVRLVGTKMCRQKVALWSTGALLVAAWFSFLVASSSVSRLTAHFAAELSDNMHFACCLAIVLLWAWRLRNDPRDWIAARFVNVLGVYLALFLLTYGVRQLAPRTSGLDSLYSMTGAWLPLGSGFALVSYQQPGETKH